MNLSSYIESGIIQAYTLGIASDEEAKELEILAERHPEIKIAIQQFSADLEEKAMHGTLKPPTALKTNVLAALDYMDRQMKGEKPSFPPPLTDNSKIEDYSEWLEKPGMILTEDFDGMFAKLIGHTPEMLTAIVWMQEMSTETHTNEIERFLVVEGSCEVTIGANIYNLFPGDMMSIPPGLVHRAITTSKIPCKVILQKVAA
jgi:mannose-6-phosphate isomerase-like protein (cupin superfamily)